jgi:hypothetical protein
MQLRLELWSRYVLSLSGIQDDYRIDMLQNILAVNIVLEPLCVLGSCTQSCGAGTF